MLGFVETLDHDEREVFYQTIAAAVPKMTEMQAKCLLLSLLGLTQDTIAAILGVAKRTVSYHVKQAVARASLEAMRYV